MENKLKAIVVDDEPLALECLCELLREIDYIEIIDTCENAMDALNSLQNKKADIMFVDIEMPKISGLQLIESLVDRPMVIITSAYNNFAIKGFDMDVIDYVLKPISYDRLLKATNKARELHSLKIKTNRQKEISKDYIFVKSNKKLEKILFNDILFVEAINNYIIIHTITKKHIVYLTLKGIMDTLPQNDFIKVQKSYIISKSKVTSIEDNYVIINSVQISISRKIKDEIIRKIIEDDYLHREK